MWDADCGGLVKIEEHAGNFNGRNEFSIEEVNRGKGFHVAGGGGI